MLFTLADLFHKVSKGKWQGKIGFYPSAKQFDLAGFESYSGQLQSRLDKQTNLKFGDAVLVTDEPTLQTLANMLYLWGKGAVVVPVRHTMSEQARLAIAQDCHASVCLHGDALIHLAPLNKNQGEAHGKQTSTTKFNFKSERRVTGADLALIIYTSGSTGKPKGIMLSHANVLNAMSSIATYLSIDEEEHILCLSPLSFDYGLYQLLFSLAYDCQLTLFEGDFHPIKVLKALELSQASLVPVVPAMASALAKMIQTFKKPLPHFKKLTNTGGHLAEDNIRLLSELLPQLQIFAMYGLTECKRALYLPPEDSLRKLGSVGVPIPGLEAKILHPSKDENHGSYNEVEQGEIGELFIRGASLMQGYFGMANAGACILAGDYRDDNWLATGDLFCQDEDGYFYFKGRSKDLIKQAGFCLYPAELESQIEQHPNVFLCAIVPHKDRWGDEIACLNVQLINPGVEQEKAFRDWLTTQIEDNYRPRQLIFIDELALTQNSKVDKQHLMASLSSG
ncbi:class I adenylate-forming enzyme family protein [Marinomonas sp. S3726]|uniref:class I adenylate-forming enzyme family protein n=1 Tax=Marinomonas sp. S3726 TaxID=579484 RepID=UPI00069631C1|nr:class I adenylate-forming enzyme family protein [Marinomonas sp. S3726]